MTTPPGLPAASPTELGRGALPAALPDGGVWLADGSFGSWRSPGGVEHAATRRAAHGGHLRLSPPRRCSSPPHSGCPQSRQSPPPPTSQHHTNRPPLTTTDGPGEQEWCPSAPHNFDATWSWPGACWHSTRSSLPPCPPALRAPQKQLILAVTQPLRWGRVRPARQGSMSGGWFVPG